MADDPVVTFRDTIRRLVPQWLQRGTAGKILYALGIQIDGFSEALLAGAAMRFPGHYSDESLPVIGRERRIRRGRVETGSSYTQRLIPWLDAHRGRGGPYAMLQQLRGFYAAAPGPFQIDLVYYSGKRFRMAVGTGDPRTDGTVTVDTIVWSPDDNTAQWARWWLFFHWQTPIFTDGTWDDPGKWDGGTWDDGGVWDSAFTRAEIADLVIVPTEWNTAHALGTVVVQPDGAELWDYPQGTWDDPGVWGGTSTPLQLRIE